MYDQDCDQTESAATWPFSRQALTLKAGSQYDARPCVASRQSCVDAGRNALER